MTGGSERLGNDRFYQISLLAVRGIKRRDQSCMYRAACRKRRADVPQAGGCKRLGSEIEWASQVRIEAGPGIYVLRMVRELGDHETLQPVRLPGFVELHFGRIPLPLHLLLRLVNLSRSGASDPLFFTLLLFPFTGRNELQNSAGSWPNVGL